MVTNFKKVDALFDAAMLTGLTDLGNDIEKRAVVLAPKDTGRLRNSVKVQTGKDKVTVSFNTPYAKRRHYENNLHPSTKLYLTEAMKSITNVSKYFKGF